MGSPSQFNKIILLIVLSILFFLGLKSMLPDRLFSENTSDKTNMLIDSVLLDLLDEKTVWNIGGEEQALAANEGEAFLKPFVRSNFTEKLERRKPVLFLPEKATDYTVSKPIVDTLLDPTLSIQGYGYLQRFYSKLKDLETNQNSKVRVAYYGDSMNDGDFIVQDFRTLLQEKFGGYGVGFVSIASLSAASRGSVVHQYSKNWQTQSFLTTKNPTTPLGIDGQVFLAQDDNDVWVKYKAGGRKYAATLYYPRLFYGHSENKKGYVRVTDDQEEEKRLDLEPDYLLNTLRLGIDKSKSVELHFDDIQNIPIYGLDFSISSGVYVDNFSLRGNSGLPLSGLDSDLMHEFDKVLNYDLIVLHYGTNVLNYGSYDYSFYEKGMARVIRKLRSCFPDADILVISSADKASKIDMQMETDRAVIPLVKAQKNLARDTGAGFINLYNLMGGDGSMVDWVDNRHLANQDYTHFNASGSRKIGGMLFEELLKGYDKYRIQLDKESEEN